MKITPILLLLFFASFVSAQCDSNQIDINEASLSDLDELTGIGPAKAQAIVDTRPFSSIDDLIDVYGIGDATLNKIKQQGLACIEQEKEDSSKNKEEIVQQTIRNTGLIEPQQATQTTENKQSESIINLNNKEISEEKTFDKSGLIKNNLVYAFCIFLIFLIFVILRNK